MLGIFILITCFSFTIVRGESMEDLLIYNNNGQLINKPYLAKDVDDSLILLCKTRLDYKKTKLSWILPYNNKNRFHKLEVNGSSLLLTVENLTENDYGPYQCMDRSDIKVSKVVNVLIKSPSSCGKGVFCDNYCVLERFICDGFVDCKNGKDESETLCGLDPCQNKIKCPDGRCIPQSWCCNSSDIGCTKPNQRNYVVPSLYNEANNRKVFRPFSDYDDDPFTYLNNPHQYADLNFLQTSIYNVFGYAILFMLIITILVLIMQCKLQLQIRNGKFQLVDRQNNCEDNSTYHQEKEIMDIMAERGVYIVGKSSFTEVAPNPPFDRGPPPPYISS